jgi:hypothetical protein
MMAIVAMEYAPLAPAWSKDGERMLGLSFGNRNLGPQDDQGRALNSSNSALASEPSPHCEKAKDRGMKVEARWRRDLPRARRRTPFILNSDPVWHIFDTRFRARGDCAQETTMRTVFGLSVFAAALFAATFAYALAGALP